MMMRCSRNIALQKVISFGNYYHEPKVASNILHCSDESVCLQLNRRHAGERFISLGFMVPELDAGPQGPYGCGVASCPASFEPPGALPPQFSPENLLYFNRSRNICRDVIPDQHDAFRAMNKRERMDVLK